MKLTSLIAFGFLLVAADVAAQGTPDELRSILVVRYESTNTFPADFGNCQDMMFDGSDSADKNYRESSFNKLGFTGMVTTQHSIAWPVAPRRFRFGKMPASWARPLETLPPCWPTASRWRPYPAPYNGPAVKRASR